MPQVHEAVKTSCPEINQQPLQHFKWNSTLYMCFRNVTVCRAGRREGRSSDWKQGCLGRRISHLIVTSCLASKAPSNCGTQSCLVLGTRLVRKTMFNSWNLTLAINFQKNSNNFWCSLKSTEAPFTPSASIPLLSQASFFSLPCYSESYLQPYS